MMSDEQPKDENRNSKIGASFDFRVSIFDPDQAATDD